ncbi:Ubiquitin carboxyl-terminal hydrolase 39 [Caenorhabditis elegans]|uniref:Ubiquitin carboxyl-terminal hydrolase 39 n=1 Tax=Caenorhabditis elegans TaxID=6239 RepID=O44787_CAEEL|nr:ubiquitinyl hydrolase 1 [Caenorhabditis elegans]CCD69090.1 ubiquitinyl hydrolase 1 [Caenorhabditis elegans]|eukprot:NP_494298.1 Ubiquitin Specific Protease [Caenorhabditis elegans]
MTNEEPKSPEKVERRRSTQEDSEKDKKRSRDDRKTEKRTHDRDRKRNRSRSRSRSRSPKRSRRDKKEEKQEQEEEDGEIRDTTPPAPEKPRQLTARELERQRIIEEELKSGKHDEHDDDPVWSMKKAQAEKKSRMCPYLDTIDRSVLDFDFEKQCSVSLSHQNVYACMVCGKYFQGRGTNTHAYTHALETDHHVFLNLQTLKFYCLPDNYEVIDPSLEDIKYVLKPTYTKEMIASIDKQSKMVRAYDDSTYFPGVVGLNNIKANDYCNAILQALSAVRPLRNWFLKESNYTSIKRPPGDKLTLLPQRFGELIRKLWNPRALRTHVSPHEMLQAVVVCSNKKFQFIKQNDAADFMLFLLTTLHSALNGTDKKPSIISKTFRGRMRQYSRRVIPAEDTDEEKYMKLRMPEYQEKVIESPFLYLTLDLPSAPLYRDVQLQNIIPQVPLSTLLEKFDGKTEKEYPTYNDNNIMKRFELLQLPDFLIITYKRFQKNQWFVEKNPTIVNFPIANVDFYDCLAKDARANHKYTTYDLVANVVHEGTFKDGNYRIQIVHEGSGKWFELEDLHVKDLLPQMIVLAESYIQIWRLNKEQTRDERAEGEPMQN